MCAVSIRLTLPLPDKALSPNARVHWAKKARAAKAARRAAWLMATKVLREARQKPPMWERATASVVILWPTAHRRDVDNAAASLKAYWDGLADAGVVANDSGLVPEPPVFLVDRRRPRVEITVSPEGRKEAR